MGKISIVVPCYNEEETIPIFFKETSKVIANMKDAEFEILFIDDGSTDGTLSELKKLSAIDGRVRYIALSKNFEKEATIYAGLENATGEYVVLMDVDLQDPPEMIPQMYNLICNEGYDCVATKRTTRKGDPIIRSFFADCFYKIINKMSKTKIVNGARDYRMMKRVMADAIIRTGEYNRFSKGIFSWVGFNTKWLEYENKPRVAGKTKWSFWKLFIYSLEGIISFSTVPLALAYVMGVLFCMGAFILIAVIIARMLIYGDSASGGALLGCIISLIGGIQLFCMGILGQYVAKIYLETKKRPIYIVKESS